MQIAHVGQTTVAIEVAKMAEHWDTKWKAEAGGLELGPFLIKEVDPTVKLSTYMELAAGAKRAGTLALRVESRGLRWMHRQIPSDESFKAAIADVARAFKEQGSLPLKLSQVHRVCARYSVPAKGREGLRAEVRRLKDRIVRLEDQVRAGCPKGTEPVE
jgi:hypothetical protein